MLGLMSERPLLDLVDPDPRRRPITAMSRSSRAQSKVRSTATPIGRPNAVRNSSRMLCAGSALGPATGSRPWPGTRFAISNCTTRFPASEPSVIRSIRGCSTTRLFISSTTLPTGFCLLMLLFCLRSSVWRRACRPIAGSCCFAMTARRLKPACRRCPVTRPCLPAKTMLLNGPNSTSAPPLRYATPRAQPAHPKGALYSHRSTVLHAFGISLPDAISISARDVVCPVVPLFHACGWGIPYAAPMNGAKLVFPGPRLDGASLYELFETEGVTYALGVPTVWLGFESHLSTSGTRCSTLHRVLSGGSAVPPSMVEAYARHGIDMRQGWGMTEMSPLGTTAALKAKHRDLDPPAAACG